MAVQLAFFGGVTEKNRIIEAMREAHPVYLGTVRSFARLIAMRKGTVTIDDVRADLEARDFPLPKEIGADDRIFGALFTRKEFRAVGQVLTTRQERIDRAGKNSSYITQYKLRTATEAAAL